MNLKQYRHRPSHDSIQCFNLFPASAEKIRKTYRLRKRVFGKNFHAKTIYNSFKQSYPVQKVSFQISSLLKNLLQKIQTTSKLSTIQIAYFHNIKIAYFQNSVLAIVDDAVLYEDDILQIGIKSSFNKMLSKSGPE